jgi:hypothetical protein
VLDAQLRSDLQSARKFFDGLRLSRSIMRRHTRKTSAIVWLLRHSIPFPQFVAVQKDQRVGLH